MALQDITRSMDYITRAYSSEVNNVIVYLLSKPVPLKTIDQLIPALMPYIMAELDHSLKYVQ
jgi:PAB-dependent poly(A)-specific ribonuclease subunit 3